MSHEPARRGFLAFTPGASPDDLDDPGSSRPRLIVNPQAIATIENLDDGTLLRLRLIDGTSFSLGPMPRGRARVVQRDLLASLGRPMTVDLPPQTSVELEQEER